MLTFTFILIGILTLFILRSALATKNYKLKVGNLDRSYRLHLPKNYDKNKKYPLIVAFHGLGDSPWVLEINSGLSRKADKENFIIAYPKGTGRKLSWNAGFCCGYAFENRIDDVGFAKNLIEKLKKDFAVNKVFLVGFSNGGMFAYNLSSQISDIDGVAVIAGTAGSNELTLPPPTSSIPLITLHGRKDQVVPFDGGGEFNFLSVEESMKSWPEKNKN